MLSIIVTGTPGTGKTTIAKALSKALKVQYLSGFKFIKDNNLLEKEDRVNVVDQTKLKNKLESYIKRSKEVIIIDSHMSQIIDKQFVRTCIVVNCSLKTLKERLEKRKYSKKKINDNLECEIMQVCEIEATEQGHKVIKIDTTKKELKEIIKYLLKILSS